MGNSQNIVVGLQSENTIKIAPYGQAEENARDLGFIKGGISVEHDETTHDVKVDQAIGAIDKVVTDEKMKIKVTLAETTLNNLALAYGYEAGSVNNGVFSFGAKENSSYYSLYINVKGTNGSLRKYCFWKVKPSGKTTQSYKRDGETVAEVEFDVLTDTTKPVEERFGMVQDSSVGTGQAPVLGIEALNIAAGSFMPLEISVAGGAALLEESIKYADQPNGSVFVYKQETDPVLVGGVLEYSAELKKITFTPALAWGQGNYTIIISTAVKDVYGLCLAAPVSAAFSVN